MCKELKGYFRYDRTGHKNHYGQSHELLDMSVLNSLDASCGVSGMSRSHQLSAAAIIEPEPSGGISNAERPRTLRLHCRIMVLLSPRSRSRHRGSSLFRQSSSSRHHMRRMSTELTLDASLSGGSATEYIKDAVPASPTEDTVLPEPITDIESEPEEMLAVQHQFRPARRKSAART
jgi:hypothetical protein